MPKPNLSKLKGTSKSTSNVKHQATISKFFSTNPNSVSASRGSIRKGQDEHQNDDSLNLKDDILENSGTNSKKVQTAKYKKRDSDSSPKGNSRKKAKIETTSFADDTVPDSCNSSHHDDVGSSPVNLAHTTREKLDSFSLSESSDGRKISDIPAMSLIRRELPAAVYFDDDDDIDNEETEISPQGGYTDAEIQKNHDSQESETSHSSKHGEYLSKFSKQNIKNKSQKGGGKMGSKNGASKSVCKYTPLEQQFMEIKEKNADAVLFVECGYKYRFFGEDAEIAAKELNIYCHLDHNFQTASIPTHRLFVHVRRLVAKGYKVGVVKQMETAALKAVGTNRSAPFTRQLTALYTKSTLIGEDVDPASRDCGDEGKTYGAPLLCIFEPRTEDLRAKPHTIAIVSVQPGTGDIMYDVFEDGKNRSALELRIQHIQPVELLLPPVLSDRTEKLLHQLTALGTSSDDRIRIERLAADQFDYDKAFQGMIDFYSESSSKQPPTSSEAGSSSKEHLYDVVRLPREVISCFHAVLTYLTHFNLHQVLRLTSNIQQYSTDSQHMRLNASAVRNLELFRNLTDGRQYGSLIAVLDHTRTNAGRRLLRQWIGQPLVDISSVESRLEAVSELRQYDGVPVLTTLRHLLAKLPDVDKGLGTIFHRKCSTLEFLLVCQALERVYEELHVYKSSIQEHVKSHLLQRMLCDLPDLLEGIGHWVKAIHEKAAREGDKTQLFTDETDFPAVYKCKEDILGVISEIQDHRREVRLALRQPGLEYVTVSGTEFLIEVRNSNMNLVPNDWVKISATKVVSRFHSPTIVAACKRLSQLREQLIKEANLAWQEFLQSFEDVYPAYKRAVHHLATLDCLFSLSAIANEDGFCRPKFTSDAAEIHIEQGRHPVVHAILGESKQFVPNDTHLKGGGERCMIITGPNMGGKSSYIKQVAVIAIMAQIGSYVPAEAATLGIIDAIYTRMGASDELFKGRSTFMVELQEASEVISMATDRSLVILDELGRGTSTHDGIALAYATLHHLVTQVKCLTLFVTHYPMLSEMEDMQRPHVANYHMSFLLNDSTQEEDDGSESLTFLYQLVRGSAGRSYGLNVARLADIPSDIIKTAALKSQELETFIMRRRCQRLMFKQLFEADAFENIKQIVKRSQEEVAEIL